jgi:hypothetical protein
MNTETLIENMTSLIRWQSEKPERRSVEFELAPERFGKPGTAWVYDYDLMVGQHVHSVEEIDLAAHREKEEREKLAELKAKYEGADA